MQRIDGFHVAIIMDGNGRWAKRRQMPRSFGHRAGVKSVREIAPACKDLGIQALTLYAFSSDNWKRSTEEVSALWELMRRYLREELATCVEKGLRLNVIGRRDRLPADLLELIHKAEDATAHFTEHVLRLAIDYSGREAILMAAQQSDAKDDMERFQDRVQLVHNANILVPPVDLLIRTGGEQRLSDFQLFEAAYAELYFTPKYWPEFRKPDLLTAVNAYRGRDRRFGAIVSA